MGTSKASALLQVEALYKRFSRGTGDPVEAVRGVTFDLDEGDSLAIVGESGCGKTTLAHCIVRLLVPDGGSIRIRGEDWATLSGRRLRAARRNVQLVFQDVRGALNPRQQIGELVEEPLRIHGLFDAATRKRRVDQLLETVHLPRAYGHRYPAELSGGERQRVGLARALILQPDLLIADEPVAMLDQANADPILRLLEELTQRFSFSLLLITHQLSLVRRLCRRTAVMYQGQFVEVSETGRLFLDPKHSYTRLLLDSDPAL